MLPAFAFSRTSIIPSMEEDVNTRRVWSPLRHGALDAFPFALTVAAIGVFAFLSGGYVFARAAPVAIVYLLVAAGWVWLLRRDSRPSPLFLCALVVFGAYVAWMGASVLWSMGPDLSWRAFDLAAFYAVVVAVVGLTPARALQLRVVGWGYLVVAVAVGIYAFLGKGLPDVVTHAHTFARLDSPVGYWNVLALMMAMGVVVALAFAGDRAGHPLWRVLAAAAAVPLSFTFFFCLSRGGWMALGVALVVYVAFTTTRLASVASLAAIAAPAAAALWHVRGLQTLFTATTNDALRTAQGHELLRWALVALAVTVVVQMAIVLVHRVVPWPRWVPLGAGVAVVVVVLVLAVGGSARFLAPRGGLSWVGDRLHTFVAGNDTNSAGEGATRLISLNTGRPPLWREALDQSRVTRLAGAGAGTFVFTNDRFRTTAGVVRHAHSEWFNVLSELGGMVAFVVHISWDWDWDMAAIGTVFFLFAAVASSYLTTRDQDERRARRGEARAESSMQSPTESSAGLSDARTPEPRVGRPWSGWPLRAAATVALVALAVSWYVPYLAGRAEDAALAASSEGDAAVALTQARRAAQLDPLAVDPLITESFALQRDGRNLEALRVLQDAARLQPDNYEVYYQQGVLLATLGRRQEAIDALRHALALNPLDEDSKTQLDTVAGS